ncbi:hypothetical protein [Paraburkholderia sp. MM5482-R1]|uniref:hypothetical protein n=1 Tax=unclassified Paraburkholderia TaxID=2615204 RepID=UPI003D200B5B
MTPGVKTHEVDEDVLIVRSLDASSDAWAGFMLERRDDNSRIVTTIGDRISPGIGDSIVSARGIPSSQSPICLCIRTDYGSALTSNIS